MKKIKYLMLVLLCGVLLVGCAKKEANLDLSIDDILTKIYADVKEEDMPMLVTIDVTKDNAEYYLGSADIDFKEAKASEPAMGSNAWSVVVVKLNDAKDAEEVKKTIKDKVDPAKWICVDAEEVHVLSKGDTVVLIMMDETNKELSDKFVENFNNLK